jgi:hypothetical protein
LFREFCGNAPKLTKAKAAKLERAKTHSFVACKKAIDGSHRQWSHVYDLTHEEYLDERKDTSNRVIRPYNHSECNLTAI